MQKKALGKGLDVLLPVAGQSRPAVAGEVQELPTEQVLASRYQPRTAFSETDLAELADSIRRNGVLQPILVRRKGDGSYEVIAGERRLRAARLAGLQTLPAVVRNVSDEQAMVFAMVENLQRKDLNPMESARGFQRLLQEFGLTQEELASSTGKDRSSIANLLRLLNLPNEIKQLIERGDLSTGHAKAILSVDRAEAQVRLARKIVAGQLSVRQSEREASRDSCRSRTRQTLRTRKPYPEIEERLQRHFGTRVEVIKQRRGGRIVLEFFDAEELDRLLQVMLG